MYRDVRSHVRVNGQYSEEFGVGVGVHQGSVLSPLLFIIVLEALSWEFCTGVSWELLHADDPAVIADTLEVCMTKLKAWENGMENRGLRVNMKKTKFMISGAGLDMLRDFGDCRSGAGANSISCSQCKLLVDKTCSGIKGRLNVTPDYRYVCPRCLDQARPIDGRSITQVEVDGTLLDVEASFCYLGNMLSAGGGCALAIATRCSTVWGKFRKLLPILTSKHVLPLTRGKVFSACISSALLHGSETWAPTAPDLQRLCKNDRAMICWICGVKPHDEVPMETLYTKLAIQEVAVALRTKHLRWYGHVACASNYQYRQSWKNPLVPSPWRVPHAARRVEILAVPNFNY